SITRQYVKKAAEAIYKELVRRKIAVEKRRPDGRGSEDIREITCEVGVAPRPHGSALFTRGQTQIMTLLTLGTAKEGQRIDDLSLETDRRYMHHYNFPPYSVGETGFMRGPKRRDIGHGAPAQRALEPVIPSPERVRGSPPCRWTSRSPALRRRSSGVRSSRQSGRASSSWTRCSRRSPSPGRSSRATRRASPPSRSIPRRSGWSSARAARRSV